MKIEHNEDYVKLRKQEYPALQELADALVHQANGNDEPMTRYLEACKAVKQKYPKPS